MLCWERSSHLVPVSMSMRKMDPSFDTEKAVVSSDVTAMAVTGSLQPQKTSSPHMLLNLSIRRMLHSESAHHNTCYSLHPGLMLHGSVQWPSEGALLR